MTHIAPIAADTLIPALTAGIGDIVALRHDLHRHPELSQQEVRTAGVIARELAAFGYEVTTGVGGQGVVGRLVTGPGKSLGLRADFDALPITEPPGDGPVSQVPGVMHACGHDGHTAILLAAARHLAQTRTFRGTLTLIFQPAEEIGHGAREMLQEGLFDRFPIDAIFGLHNWPGLPAGAWGIRPGPVMAAVDQVNLTVRGEGGHGAMPQDTVDPIVTLSGAITALHSVVSRNIDPLEAAVVTVGSIRGGEASNVIPDHAEAKLTLRSFSPAVRDQLGARVPALLRSVSEGYGATAEADYCRGFPAVVNHPAETALARAVVEDTFGPEALIPDFQPRMASEDFAFFLNERPGAFLILGNGPGAPLHSPDYRFDDAILVPAAALWVRLAERFLNGETA